MVGQFEEGSQHLHSLLRQLTEAKVLAKARAIGPESVWWPVSKSCKVLCGLLKLSVILDTFSTFTSPFLRQIEQSMAMYIVQLKDLWLVTFKQNMKLIK